MNTNIITAIVIIIIYISIILYACFIIKVNKQKKEMPKEVFQDLMNNKCAADCQNCTCGK